MSGAMVTYINLEILANLLGVSASLTVVVHSQVSFAMSVLNLPLLSRSVEEIQKTIKRYSILYIFFGCTILNNIIIANI